MEPKTPNRCPDDAYVEQRLFDLLKGQMERGNRGAVAGGSVFRYANRRSFAKLLAHYEVWKLVQAVPGHIVELGVFKGESLLRFAQLAEIFLPYDRSFEVIGFDNFAGFPALHPKDGPAVERNDKGAGGWSSEAYRLELLDLINVFDNDRFAPQKPRVRLIEGDIRDTLPRFVQSRPGLKTKLVHLDADLYEPTKVALEHLWDTLSPGGVLLLDEYGFDLFPGEAAAVDEFFAARNISLPMQKLPFSDNPGAFVVKA